MSWLQIKYKGLARKPYVNAEFQENCPYDQLHTGRFNEKLLIDGRYVRIIHFTRIVLINDGIYQVHVGENVFPLSKPQEHPKIELEIIDASNYLMFPLYLL